MKKNDEFELDITDTGNEGEGITPSPFRVTPPCPIAGKCGGCQLQNVDYPKQLEIKESKVYNDIVRLGKVDPSRINQRDGSLIENDNEVVFHKIIGMDDTCHYRNKGQFPVGLDKEGKIVTGFYAGHTHSIIPTEKCMIQHELTDGIMQTVRDFMEKFSVPVYVEREGSVTTKEASIGDHDRSVKKTKSADRTSSKNQKYGIDTEDGLRTYIHDMLDKAS